MVWVPIEKFVLFFVSWTLRPNSSFNVYRSVGHGDVGREEDGRGEGGCEVYLGDNLVVMISVILTTSPVAMKLKINFPS